MASKFPPAPTNAIDWNNLGFATREVKGHIECHYNTVDGQWTEPKWVEDPFLRVHGLAPGLNYGQQCYEGIKAFRDPSGQINIFRPTQNAERMRSSASYIMIPDLPSDVFLKAIHLAVGMNAEYVPPHETGGAMYIRPLLFGSQAMLALNPCDEYTFTVYVLPVGVYHGVHPVAALILEDFDRAAPEGTGAAKIGGNYAPVLKHSAKAREEGFGITLHLDSRTRTEIDEFSTSGFVGVKQQGDRITLVVPDSKNVIKSVTSTSVCDLAKSFGWSVEVRSIKYEELPSFTEVMACGTAAALVPIKSITRKSTNDVFKYHGGDDQPGPIVVKLLENLQGIQRGKLKDEFGWLSRVEAPAADFGGAVNGTGTTNGTTQIDQLP